MKYASIVKISNFFVLSEISCLWKYSPFSYRFWKKMFFLQSKSPLWKFDWDKVIYTLKIYHRFSFLSSIVPSPSSTFACFASLSCFLYMTKKNCYGLAMVCLTYVLSFKIEFLWPLVMEERAQTTCLCPANNYLFKVNNWNTSKKGRSGVFIVNFELISHLSSIVSIVDFEH